MDAALNKSSRKSWQFEYPTIDDRLNMGREADKGWLSSVLKTPSRILPASYLLSFVSPSASSPWWGMSLFVTLLFSIVASIYSLPSSLYSFLSSPLPLTWSSVWDDVSISTIPLPPSISFSLSSLLSFASPSTSSSESDHTSLAMLGFLELVSVKYNVNKAARLIEMSTTKKIIRPFRRVSLAGFVSPGCLACVNSVPFDEELQLLLAVDSLPMIKVKVIYISQSISQTW